MADVSEVILERLSAIFWAAGFGIIVSWIAWSKGYYSLPADHSKGKKHPGWVCPLKAFGIFLFIELVMAPALFSLWIYWEKGTWVDPKTLPLTAEFHGWVNLAIIAATGTGLILYYRSLNQSDRDAIWGGLPGQRGLGKGVRNFLMGSLTWLIAYPWIIVLGQFIAILLYYFYTGPLPDQAAVKHLKDIVEHPALFYVTVLVVVSIIPFIEELLFRGFLQAWLKTCVGRSRAIAVTSLIFALFHYSSSQGIENFEYLFSLFLLSCFLGFIKERQQSLWGSVGLHSTFNLISVWMLSHS